MRNLQQYWQEIRALEASLPPFVWVIANDCLSEVSAYLAAKLLHAKSHRIATEDEVLAHTQKGAVASREAARVERRWRGVEVVSVD